MANEYIRRENALYAIQRQRGATRSPAQNRLLDSIRADIARVPAADVAEVVRGKPVVKVRPVTITDYHEEIGRFAADGSTLYRKNMVHVEIPYKHCPVCGATLCSRWYNYCGKCGAKMDGGENDVSG